MINTIQIKCGHTLCGRFCFMYYLLSDNNNRNVYSTMNINETELREAVNEVRTRFYDIFNRMNNATILK